MHNVAPNTPYIAEDQGCIVPRLGSSGYRHSNTDESKWGGKRIRSLDFIQDHWEHADAFGRASQLIEAAVLKVKKNHIVRKLKCKMETAKCKITEEKVEKAAMKEEVKEKVMK